MITKTVKALAIAGVVAGATATAAYAYPHTGYQVQIENQINSVIAGARGQGFNLIVANQRGQMYTGGNDVYFIVYLQAGATYRFAARCELRLHGSRSVAPRRERPRGRRRSRLRRHPDLQLPCALHRRLPGHARNGALPFVSLPGRRGGARQHHLTSPEGGPTPPPALPAFHLARNVLPRHGPRLFLGSRSIAALNEQFVRSLKENLRPAPRKFQQPSV